MNEWFSPAELAAFQLPSFPHTKRNVQARLNKPGVKYRPRQAQGGGKEYHISSLPSKVRKSLQAKLAKELLGTANLPTTTQNKTQLQQPTGNLTACQREAMLARAAFVQRINEMATLMGRSNAIDAFVEYAKAGTLPEHLQALVSVANNRTCKGRTVSRRTLYNWVTMYDKTGVQGLAPEIKKSEWHLPDWAPLFMALWAQPHKPKITECLALMQRDAPENIHVPSYDTIKRWIKKHLSVVERNRGRMGPQELKALQAFTRRDTSDLWPGAVFTSDGHTFKARVQHPHHGQPFRPEVTLVEDVYTRYITGWSVGLAENTFGVIEALAASMVDRADGRKAAMPAIFYTDNGPGFVSEELTNALTGFFARWGITHKKSLPYNSQARGMIERLNKMLIKAAKELPSYTGGDLDKQARRQMQQVQVAQKHTPKSTIFDVTWPAFQAHIQEAIDDYNHTPHTGLPRERDENMVWKHLTPAEMWHRWEAQGGEVLTVPHAERADLVRPYEIRTVRRCEVQMPTGKYFSEALEGYHTQKVMVGYDIHDAKRVWVRDLQDEHLIAVAELDGNKVPYFDGETMRTAVSMQELTLKRRTKGRIKRLENKLEEVHLEAKGPPLELTAQPVEILNPEDSALADKLFAELEAVPAQFDAAGRPIFADDLEWVTWLQSNPEMITNADRNHLANCLDNSGFRHLLEFAEIDPKPLLDRAA